MRADRIECFATSQLRRLSWPVRRQNPIRPRQLTRTIGRARRQRQRYRTLVPPLYPLLVVPNMSPAFSTATAVGLGTARSLFFQRGQATRCECSRDALFGSELLTPGSTATQEGAVAAFNSGGAGVPLPLSATVTRACVVTAVGPARVSDWRNTFQPLSPPACSLHGAATPLQSVEQPGVLERCMPRDRARHSRPFFQQTDERDFVLLVPTQYVKFQSAASVHQRWRLGGLQVGAALGNGLPSSAFSAGAKS